jgi:DNA-binding transcriptional ArsR family regulator
VSAPTAVFAALGDSQRLGLLERLSEDGLASATKLAAPLPVTRQAVTKHLRVLEDAGLVQARRSGREVLYAVRVDGLRASADWLIAAAAAWDRRLQSIKTLAEQETPVSRGSSRGRGGGR